MQAVKKFNSNIKNPYFVGDIHIDKDGITYTRYYKITNPTTLEEIDKSTTNFKNKYELKTLYHVEEKTDRSLYITYRAKGDIRTLNIMYQKDKDLINKNYIADRFCDLGTDINFVNKVLNSNLIECSARDEAFDAFDSLYVLRDKLKYELPALVSTLPMRRFFNLYTSNNYLHYRQLAALVLNYQKANEELEVPEETKEEKKEVKEEVFGQMMIEDYANQILKDQYEDLKIAIGEGSLDEVYAHKLIPRRK